MTSVPTPPPKQQWEKVKCSRLSYSGSNFAIDDKGILTADCTYYDTTVDDSSNSPGEFRKKYSSLNLSEILGWSTTAPAHFVWSGKEYNNRGFLASWKNGGELQVQVEKWSQKVCLWAEMGEGGDDKYTRAGIDLQERIVIVDGQLQYVRNGLTLNDGRTMHGPLTEFMTISYPDCEGVIEPTGSTTSLPADFVRGLTIQNTKDNILFDTKEYRSEAYVGGGVTVKDGQEVTDYTRYLGASVTATGIGDLGYGTHISARADLVDGRIGALSGRLGVGIDTGVQTKDSSVRAEILGTGFTLGRKVGVSVLGIDFEIDFGRLG